MDSNTYFSGVQCLRMLFARYRRTVNFDALLTPAVQQEFQEDVAAATVRLATDHRLGPLQFAALEELQERRGPALAESKLGNWILIVNVADLNVENGTTQIFAPENGNEFRKLAVTPQELQQRCTGKVVFFSELSEVDIARHSRLYAFCAIAGHHNVSVDIRELMHEYAVGEEEVREALFRKIAEDYDFKVRKVRLKWPKLLECMEAMPMVVVKENGKYAILCGLRREEGADGQEEIKAVVIDPEEPVENSSEPFRVISAQEYQEKYGDRYILLKKRYSLSSENQPFSLRWFIPEFLKQKAIFCEIAIAVAMMTVISLVVPMFFQIVVDKVLVNQANNTLNVLGVGVVCAILFNCIAGYVRSYLLLFASNKIDISTATKTFAHLMRLPVDFFERVPSGVLLKHMQQNEKIRGFLSGNLFFTVLDIFALAIFIPFLLCYSVTLTLVVLGFAALMALVIASLVRPFQRRLDELYQAEGRRQSMLVEAIHGVRTVKSLALEPVEKRIWDDTTAYAIKSYFRVGKISMAATSISQMLEMLMTICVIWVGAHLFFDHVITIGALIAFQMLSGRVTGPLVKMVGLIHEYQQIALSVRMLGVVMNTPAEPAGGGVRNAIRGQIEMENVSFRYRQDLPFVIRDFSLNIEPGMTVGFVGRSGSGKTTITKLLQALYPVNQGVVRIDGIDIRELDKAHLRRNIGVVLQDNYFFSGTVRQNIALPKQNASLEEIIYAAKLAGADDFIQKLHRGYDTMLEENASNLSGGQRQRLAIARALLTNPPILIFDEATSALDPESEEVIRRNLKAIAKGRTVLIVSHRLSIVSHADKIVVIDAGVEQACGTHRQLKQQPGIYREFWNQQMRGDD